VKQHLCDTLWATRGKGAHGERFNPFLWRTIPATCHSPQAKDLARFSSVTRFFSGARDVLAAIDDEISTVRWDGERRQGQSFEDQYLSTGGQLYELIMAMTASRRTCVHCFARS